MKNIIEHLKMYYDELGLAYEKAEKDSVIAKELSDIEEKALQEARENCALLNNNEVTLSPDKFDCLNDAQKAGIIYNLGKLGLISFLPNSIEGTIELNLSSNITKTLHCTMFSILNRLEKLDGAINVRHPKVDFNINVPVGGKGGLMKCQMLMMMLYPWLNVHERASDVVAEKEKAEQEEKNPTKESTQNLLTKDIVFSSHAVDGFVGDKRAGFISSLIYNSKRRRVEQIVKSFGEEMETNTNVETVLNIPESVRTEELLTDYIILKKPEYKDKIVAYLENKKRFERIINQKTEEKNVIQPEEKKEEPKYQIEYNIDIAFCIDASGSMEKHLDRVKEFIPKMCEDIRKNLKYWGKELGNLRARIIVFRDYIADGKDAMLTTEFFNLPKEQKEFVAVINGVETTPYGHGPSNGLEALAYAIASKWSNEYTKKRRLIVVFSDSMTHYLGYGKLYSGYPGLMAKDMEELTKWWNNPNLISQGEKRLFIFAPDTLYWSEISDNWGNVIHFPSEAGKGLGEYDYNQILDSIHNDI